MNLFGRKSGGGKKNDPEDVMRPAKETWPMLMGLVNDIVVTYREPLMSEDVNFIINAVWGAVHDGPLNDTQREIHGKVVSVTGDIKKRLGFNVLEPSQKYAVDFFLRDIIISKIMYVTELAKCKAGLSGGMLEGAAPQFDIASLFGPDSTFDFGALESSDSPRRFGDADGPDPSNRWNR